MIDPLSMFSLGWLIGYAAKWLFVALTPKEPPPPCDACARCPLDHDEDPRFPFRRSDGTF